MQLDFVVQVDSSGMLDLSELFSLLFKVEPHHELALGVHFTFQLDVLGCVLVGVELLFACPSFFSVDFIHFINQLVFEFFLVCIGGFLFRL